MISNFPVKFGDYTLHELIGRGGMAEVYRATKAGIGGFEKPVAIKMILPHLAENEDFIAMLTDEARIIVSISHSNIAQVYDFCFDSGRYFIAMEYIHGIDVADLNKRMDQLGERVAVEHSVFIAICMCAGLHYAHTKVDKEGNLQNIVHRDVSPQNILLNYAGEVKLIDFGVAKARNRDATTQAGVIKGKLHYMAPEQAKGEALDGRADIFAAGIVLYELLTGQLPFDGETEFEIYNNLVNSVITPPSALNPEVPKELDRVVLKMLQRELDKRYPSGYAARQDLEQVLYHIAPGYTNTRLSRYIETMIEREQAKARGLEDPGKQKKRSDTVERPSISILGEQETESTILQDKFDDEGTKEEEGVSQPSPISDSNPFDTAFGFDMPEVSASNERSMMTGGGLNSITALVVFFLVGLAIIVSVSIGVFYLLSPSTFSPLSPVEVASAEPAANAPLDDGQPTDEADAGDGGIPGVSKGNRDGTFATVTSWAVEPDETVVLKFDSLPPGVEVHHDGAILGTTPLVIYTEKSDKPGKFMFVMDDYDDVQLDVTPDHDINELISMNLRSVKSKTNKRRNPNSRPPKGPKTSSTGLIDPFGY